ncbi:MAG TPA: hypothetical protein VLD19_02620 [Chitinophagaceae bacterium]|nr:hypothetical protein [Chitinophagaceae bacterium]
MEKQPLTEQESLQIITEMIQKVKSNFHTSGTSAILWGSVVGIAGLVSFAERNWNFYIGFDIWLVVLAAVIPQVFITIREKRNKKVVSHHEAFLEGIWLAYGISVFALVFYMNVIQGVAERQLALEGKEFLVKDLHTGIVQHLRPYVLSNASLLLILYGIPTLATGIAMKFRPMLVGGIICYALFVISCYTETKYDYLFNGIAGIANWLIPGLILRYRTTKATAC